MKKNSWSEKVQGHVRATVKGRLVEPFINRCVREHVTIWDIQRVGEDRIQCSILLSDIRRIKRILKDTDCRIHFEDRVGLPFWTRRLLNRTGLIGGFILFFIILFILSNMVWRIQIKGADPILENQIRQILAKQDIHVGAVTFLLPSLGEIEDQLSSRLKDATWVGVSRDGTTYRIDVVQKELPKKEEEVGPRDLIATKTATIRQLYVEKGQAVVQKNEVVKKGQLLVSGTIGSEEDPSFVPAKGTVMGETWYTSDTEVPLSITYHTYTGQTYLKRQIKLGKVSLPIWGFKAQPFKKETTETVSQPIHFILWDLPISFETLTIREASQVKYGLTKTEANQVGQEMARKQLQRQLPADAKILSETVQRESLEQGILKLHIFFTVEEDIAKPRSFHPQDREQELKDKAKKEQAQ